MAQRDDDFTKLATAVEHITTSISEFDAALKSASHNEQSFELHGQIYDYVTKNTELSDDIKEKIHSRIDSVLPGPTGGGKKSRKSRRSNKSKRSRKRKH
jgi:hypothetical protein